MHTLFYWTGAVVWTIASLGLLIVVGLLAWAFLTTLARTCSVLRFNLALRRKGRLPPEPQWVRTIIRIFIRVWESDDSLEFVADDGSRWKGVGKWSINDKPLPAPNPTGETPAE